MSAAEIADRRTLSGSTIYAHLARCIEEGELELREVVALPEAEIEAVKTAFEHVAPEESMGLKPVYDALEGKYPYDWLRCIRTAMGTR